MSLRTAILAATPLLAGAAALGPASPRPTSCRDVHGTIRANVDRIRPALNGLRFDGTGTSEGDIEGAVAVRVYKLPGADLRLRLLITTGTGPVEVSGNATVRSRAAEPDVRSIQGTWRVAAHDGAGSVTGTGTADTRARSARIEYAGRICGENPAVDANPRVARRDVRKRLAGAP